MDAGATRAAAAGGDESRSSSSTWTQSRSSNDAGGDASSFGVGAPTSANISAWDNVNSEEHPLTYLEHVAHRKSFIVSETRIPLLLIHVLETMQRSAIKKESHRGMIDVPTWVVREHCPSLLLFSDDEGNPVMGHRVRENALNGQHRVFADPGNRVYSSAVKLICESFCNFQRRTIKQDEGIKKLLLLSAEHMADVAEATLSLLRRDESSSADSKMDIWHFEQLIIALLVSGHPTDTYKSKGKKMPKRCRIAPKPVAIVDMYGGDR